MLTKDANLPRALALDDEWPELDAADQAMLAYAIKLTRTPGQITEEDVEILSGHGFDDRGVLDICQVVAYFNYVNRLADGVGVELEEAWADREFTVTRAEFEERRRSRAEGA